MKQPKALGLLVCLIVFINIEPAIGMFDATLRVIEMIIKNDTTYIDATGLKVRKVNRTQHVVFGSIIFNSEVGDEFVYTTNSYKKAGNAWKKLPYKYGPFPFCQYMDGEKFFFDAVRKVADLPAKGTCPWPKGTYHINNYVMTIENIPPVFSSGEYKLEGVVALDGKLANGLNFLIDLVSIQ